MNLATYVDDREVEPEAEAEDHRSNGAHPPSLAPRGREEPARWDCIFSCTSSKDAGGVDYRVSVPPRDAEVLVALGLQDRARIVDVGDPLVDDPQGLVDRDVEDEGVGGPREEIERREGLTGYPSALYLM